MEKIIYYYEPFPHVIIENVYDDTELKFIWNEIDYLTNNNMFKDSWESGGSKAIDPVTGEIQANSFTIILDKLYKDRSMSNILNINRKMFTTRILEKFSNLHPIFGHVDFINQDITKLKYYQDANYYKSHKDISRYTICTYFFKEPKKFSGGDLYFEQFDYTIPIKNNMSIFFVGGILHASTELRMTENKSFSGNGKYCMTQFLDINYENIQADY